MTGAVVGKKARVLSCRNSGRIVSALLTDCSKPVLRGVAMTGVDTPGLDSVDQQRGEG